MSQPPYGQPYPSDPNQGQPQYGQQPYPGQPYSGQPYPGQPNPDVPTSVPPQPGYPPTTAYPTSGQPSYGQPPQPQPGQPQYGQPQYGQPQYGQPEYGQPQYGQPQYGQPEYGQPQYGQPGFPPPTPPKKSKALPIVLISIAVVLVLCIGGSVAVYMAAKNKVDDVKTQVDSAVSALPTAPSTGEPTTGPATTTSTIKITEPKTLGGRPKLTDAQFTSVAKQLQGSLKSVPGATNSVGALYGVSAKKNIVIVAAAEAPIDDPAKELDQIFYGAGIGGLQIDNITSVSTGSLGGSAKCGSASSSGVDMAICSWTDDGSLGMMIWYFKSVGKAKAEFPKLRAQVETKG
jgi:hypothetical protein